MKRFCYSIYIWTYIIDRLRFERRQLHDDVLELMVGGATIEEALQSLPTGKYLKRSLVKAGDGSASG